MFVGFSCNAHGVGRRRAISKSNSRNRIATRKNRMENGRRAEPNGSNPHSYGESFSVSGLDIGIQNPIIIRIKDNIEEKINININKFIIFP